MEINTMVKKAHHLALEAGWWLDYEINRHLSPEARAAKHMLMVSEIAEATEEVRNPERLPPVYQFTTIEERDGDVKRKRTEMVEPGASWDPNAKPLGEAVELADCVIRIADYFGFMGWDLDEVIRLKHQYNVQRAFRHGNKAL